MHRTTTFAAVTLVAALTLVGCSTDSSQNASPTMLETPSTSASTDSSPETYELGQTFTATASYGAELTVEIPTAGPAEVEQLRNDLNAEPIIYAKVGIDNREGTEDVSVYIVTIYDEDGTAYEFGDLSVDHIASWGPNYTDALGGVEGEYGYTLPDGTVLEESIGDDLNDRSITLHNQYLNGTNASKLEVSTGWLAATTVELPKRITGITIQPNGMGEEVPMTPGGTIPSTKPSKAPTTAAPAPTDNAQDESESTGDPASGTSSDQKFTYEEALAALNNGMAYYEAFCIRYEPTTDGGRSQCEGIEAGTVDPDTGEYIGD